MRASSTRASRDRRSGASARAQRRSLRHRRSGSDPRGAPGLAPAGGLTLPHLGRLRRSFTLHSGQALAAGLGARLLECGVAHAADWKASKKNPVLFIERTLARWTREAGGDVITDEHLSVMGAIATQIDGWELYRYDDEEVPPPSLERVYIGLDMPFYTTLELGPIIDLLKPIHPRLPATVRHALLGGFGRVLPVYGPDDAFEFLEMQSEWYEEGGAMEESDSQAARDVAARESLRIPDLYGTPLKAAAARRAVEGATVRARKLVEAALELAAATSTVTTPHLSHTFIDDEGMDDWQDPNPAIVIVLNRGDLTERVWDAVNDMRAQGGVPSLPPRILRFDATDDEQLIEAHREYTAWVRSCAAAERVLRCAPKGDPAALANVLDDMDEEPAVPVRVRV